MKLFSILTASLLSLQILCLSSLSHAQNHTTNVSHPAEDHWSYIGSTGPTHWAELDSGFFLCGQNRSVYESPININTSYAVDRGGSGMRRVLRMRPSMYKTRPSVENPSFMCQNPRGCCQLQIGCRRFSLVQFHFHSPSEHLINGDRKDFEIHLVHADEDHNFAVVAILFDEFREGDDDEYDIVDLSAALSSMRSEKDFRFDLRTIIDRYSGFYRFPGSLTTPPCSIGVEWIVQTKIMRATRQQMMQFRRMVGPFPRGNWRPTQPVNGRIVRHYSMAL